MIYQNICFSAMISSSCVAELGFHTQPSPGYAIPLFFFTSLLTFLLASTCLTLRSPLHCKAFREVKSYSLNQSNQIIVDRVIVKAYV